MCIIIKDRVICSKFLILFKVLSRKTTSHSRQIEVFYFVDVVFHENTSEDCKYENMAIHFCIIIPTLYKNIITISSLLSINFQNKLYCLYICLKLVMLKHWFKSKRKYSYIGNISLRKRLIFWEYAQEITWIFIWLTADIPI